MTSTLVRNSRLPDDWLRQACQMNPIQALGDRFLSGPVRLAFPSVFTAKENKRDNGDIALQFEATLLFPPIVDLSLPWNAATQIASTKWSKNVVEGQLVDVGMPFTAQAGKSIKYEGFTPGGWKLTARSKFQPRVLDVNGNAVTDPARIYPGVWAIVDFNFYTSEIKGNRVNTSLNIIYLFADDVNLGGGAPDPTKGLAAIKGMAPIMGPPTALSPAVAQGGAPAPNVAPPTPQAAYAPPVASYAAPAASYAPPVASYAAPAASYAPVVETEEQRMLREAGLV